MKTKAQKSEELKKGAELLDKSAAVIFVDFANVKTADMKTLRRDLKKAGSPLFIMKKRILALMMKQKGMELGEMPKTSVGAVFASDLESVSSSVYKFFKQLETDKKVEGLKIVGGYDVKNNRPLLKNEMVAIGSLPPREVLLAQLLGMMAAPIRSFLYVLDQKSKKSA
jgi:large subunit ribosomal protein L10